MAAKGGASRIRVLSGELFCANIKPSVKSCFVAEGFVIIDPAIRHAMFAERRPSTGSF